MGYKVVLTPHAARSFKKLEKRITTKLKPIISALADNPYPTNSKKLTGSREHYRIRDGKYRILYSIRKDERIVFVLEVRHRKDIYRLF